MKKNKGINKKKLSLVIILFFILLVLLSLLFAPSLIEGRETKKLKQEVEVVNKMLEKENIDTKEINNYQKKNITTGQRKTIEKSVENYLKDITDNCNKIINIKNDKTITNSLNIKTIETNNHDFSKEKEYINNKKEELSKLKKELEELLKNKMNYIEDNTNEEIIELYQKILKIKNIDKYININDILIKNIDILNEGIDYLSNNKDNWKIENNTLTFMKRNKFTEYETILNKIENKINLDISKPTLIKDETAPIIEANDITIIEGTNINIKEKITCKDEVDDELECNITGNFDTNKVGEYTLNITATDKSNNKSNKTIKIKVNKKEVNKPPYYTEVIRNQNTVIVYGLDDNKEYTKIIKVMPCSVGREGQETPTGTFTTSNKYRWGGLYGGVWGQYSTRIVSDILFHSVPYYSQNPSDLEWEEYNKLGSPASLGCVRMTVRDVKWLFENCPSGMTVKIYDGDLPNGVSKPSAPKIDGTSPNKGWDPTDPDPSNPWNQ